MITHPPTLWAGAIDSKAVGAERPHGQFYSFALQSCKIGRNKAPNFSRSGFVNSPKGPRNQKGPETQKRAGRSVAGAACKEEKI